MPIYAYVIILAGIALWALPFALVGSKHQSFRAIDKRARWGVALQALGFALLWQGQFWTRTPPRWQIVTSTMLFAIGVALSWTASFALGKYFRIEASISADHRLIRSGPYGFVRHPIYTSMLAVLLGTGVLLAPWYLFAAGIAAFLIGTTIRTRTEDKLLESQFGDEFRKYKREVSRLIPLIGRAWRNVV